MNIVSERTETASTLAVVAASREPLLFLDADLRILAASTSFCDTFSIDSAGALGRRLSDLGDGAWSSPSLGSLLRTTASGVAKIDAYEFDYVRGGDRRSLLLSARKLDDGDIDHIRLLLAITDVTGARAEARHKDDLVREKAVLLREVQHRVANSLQIIASVLMQSARKVQSEEARGYLQSAHHRVMSIAAVQRQLADSELGDVALRPYLTQLCASLGASMISDPERLSIKVDADEMSIDAHSSVSLGLIVTELVINALKHAFPEQARGEIDIELRTNPTGWVLSVNDDGVGIPEGEKSPKPGLGTGIVEALARQLNAEISMVDMRPGTSVRLVQGGLTSEAAQQGPAR